MLVNGKSMIGLGSLSYMGCSCHNKKNARRKFKHSAKQAEKRAWKQDQLN